MLTRKDIDNLGHNGVICIPRPNRDPERWRVNGRLQTWKRDPNRFRLPIKHGLYAYSAITEDDLHRLNSLGAYVEGSNR